MRGIMSRRGSTGMVMPLLATGGLQPVYEASQTTCAIPQSAAACMACAFMSPLTSGVTRLARS